MCVGGWFGSVVIVEGSVVVWVVKQGVLVLVVCVGGKIWGERGGL